uniref:Uncharacterized protein n=1 Tax=Dicentrarchus labrax TaxID=13489 RepID=A0A8C4NVA2_DICLA
MNIALAQKPHIHVYLLQYVQGSVRDNCVCHAQLLQTQHCLLSSITHTNTQTCACAHTQAGSFTPGEQASKLFCVKGMRSLWGRPWGDGVRGSALCT